MHVPLKAIDKFVIEKPSNKKTCNCKIHYMISTKCVFEQLIVMNTRDE